MTDDKKRELEGAIEHFKIEMAKIRTGRANPAILAKLPNANELLTALDNAIAEIQANDLLKKKTANEPIKA